MPTMCVGFIIYNSSVKIPESAFMAPSNKIPVYYSHKHIPPQLGANHHGNTLANIALQVSEERTRETHIPPNPTPNISNYPTKLIYGAQR